MKKKKKKKLNVIIDSYEACFHLQIVRFKSQELVKRQFYEV